MLQSGIPPDSFVYLLSSQGVLLRYHIQKNTLVTANKVSHITHCFKHDSFECHITDIMDFASFSAVLVISATEKLDSALGFLPHRNTGHTLQDRIRIFFVRLPPQARLSTFFLIIGTPHITVRDSTENALAVILSALDCHTARIFLKA